MKLISGLVFASLLALPALAEDAIHLQAGIDAYTAGEFHQAINTLLPIAEAGDPEAQFYVAKMYDEGEGVELDDAEAAKWYRMAAEQGDADAQYNLGLMLSEGEGVPEDDTEAFRWVKRAADQGDIEAKSLLGLMYQTGEGTTEDPAEALRLYRLASEQGDTDAQFGIATIYDFGEGIAEDNQEAVRWYRLAAEHGNPNAQNFLGLSYELGEGIPENKEEAFFWLSLAAEKDVDFIVDRDRVRANLSSFQLVRLQRRLAGWTPIVAADNITSRQKEETERTLSDELVGEAQTGLRLLGYFSNATDGQSDFNTERAIRAFQQEWGLPVTGDATPELIFYIGAAVGSFAENTLKDGTQIVEGSGTGFLISGDGYIVTNAHVVGECGRVTMGDNDVVSVVQTDDELDLAILKADATNGLVPLKLRSGRGVHLGEEIMVGGFPLEQFVTPEINITSGIVSALSGAGRDETIFQMTAPTQPGNSGGPVLDRAGYVIGVTVSTIDGRAVEAETGSLPQNVNFAVSLGTLKLFLDRHGIPYESENGRKQKSNEQRAEIARLATVPLQCRK